ncbi:MAG: SDR family NAD(P)-dependent oxidoreductase, partial [Pirellula sp.]
MYKTCWKRWSEVEQTQASREHSVDIKHWLVLSLGDSSIAKGLQSQLHDAGCSVQTVCWNSEDKAWNVSSEELRSAERIVLIHGDPSSEKSDLSQQSAEFIQQRCEEQLGVFAKALEIAKAAQSSGSLGSTNRRVFWLVTQGASLISESPALSPFASVLWGGARVASIEMSEYWGGSIDHDGSWDRAIEFMKRETVEDQLILLGNEVWVPRLQKVNVVANGHPTSLGDNVLITGGLGAIGLRFAEYAASQGAKHLVLVGRNARPGAEQIRRLDNLKKQGVSLQLISADVSNQEGFATLAAALKDQPIHSVFHTAGVDLLAPIAQWNSEDIRRVT